MNKPFTFNMILLLLPFSTLFFQGCDNVSRGQGKEIVLSADRKAPLGWMYLTIYKDKSFAFISKGLRDQTIYPGTVKVSSDTLHFTYRDSIPNAGMTAIVTDKSVSYIEGSYPESLEIKVNKLTK
jgi:hypothetical protein